MNQSNVILHFDNDWGLSVVNDPDTKSVEVWPISFHRDGMASRVGNGPYLISVSQMVKLCEEIEKYPNSKNIESLEIPSGKVLRDIPINDSWIDAEMRLIANNDYSY